MTSRDQVFRTPPGGTVVFPSRPGMDGLSRIEKALDGMPVVFLVEESASRETLPQAHLEREGAKSIGFRTGTEGEAARVREKMAAFPEGAVFVVVAGPVQARRGTLLHAAPGVAAIMMDLGRPVVPVYVAHPREELLSIEAPSEYPECLIFAGDALEPGAGPPDLMRALSFLWEREFSERPVLRGHLARAVLEGLKRHGTTAGLVDGMDGSKMGYDRVLGAAIALSFEIRKLTKKPRIGIILPPGRAGIIANHAALFAGKVPVNLNYTAGREQVESSIRQADLDRFLTVDAFVRRMQRFPWPPNQQLFFLERELPKLKSRIVRWVVLSKLLPAGILARYLGLPKSGDRDEAVLLFTSGSSGEPKGVPLSHRNTLGNTAQFASRLNLATGESLLGSLPLFHSFGCTVTLWYPAIEGVSLVTFPSPLEVERIAGLVAEHEVAVLLATPTFLRGYLRKAKPEQLAPLKLVITGAEKLPDSLAEAFQKRFGKEVLEGYGLTETSPVTNFNLPNLPHEEGAPPVVASHRHGSVGQLVPGLAVQVVDPDSNKPLPAGERGILWFKGANVFDGYLGWGDRNREVVEDGWLRTGDLGRVDDDGFLHIEGRLSRFSKIGGEMVPHEKVEESIVRALGLEGEDQRHVAVVGVPDPAKGEALVLLGTEHSKCGGDGMEKLRESLLEGGMSALWIPRKLVPVSEIPVLASGKLDLKACARLASQDANAK